MKFCITLLTLLIFAGCYNRELLNIPKTNSMFNCSEETLNGYCTVTLNKKSLRARLMIYRNSKKISTVLMDELGVPLLISQETEGNIELKKIFPPLNPSDAKIIASSVHSYLRLINLEKSEKNIQKDITNIASTIYFPMKKRAVIFIKKKKFTLSVNNKSYLLNSGLASPIFKVTLDEKV